jgi:hypothetical protein
MVTTSHPTTDVFVQTDLELSGNGKNAKMDFAPGFSLSIPKISLAAPHATSSDSVAPFTTTPALETRSKTADFAQIFEKATKSEISPKTSIFSQPTPTITSLNSPAPSHIIPALETRKKTAGFTQKSEDIEDTYISTQTTPQTPSPSIVGHADDVARVHTSLGTLNNAVF